MEFQPESTGSEASAERQHEHWRGKGYPLRTEKADALTRSPLPSPHTGWQVGRSFAVYSPHWSLDGCCEMMSPRCWISGLVAKSVPITGLVLVARHGHADAESNWQLQMMHPT